MIRKPIISVLGHVDHGKTLFLDKVRGTTLAEREAGKITQHIGATEVPTEIVTKLSGKLIETFGFSLNIPGLLFIDTPGHEAFTNLRKRGGSIADLAVLIVDITQGFQPQTMEALEILRSYKTPFIVGATKIDKLMEWESKQGSFLENLKSQSKEAKKELDEKIYKMVSKLHRKGFTSERLDRCEDFTKQIPIIPISNTTGEGIPEALLLLAGLSQKFLKKELEVETDERMQATILEVKEEKGLGKTIDVILYTGQLSVGDKIAVGGKKDIIKTKVRALLKPRPLEEMRDTKKKFKKVKKASAACGVKIAAPNLDEAIAGSPVRLIEEKNAEDKISREIESIKVRGKSGIIIKADTLGSLEALSKVFSEKGYSIKRGDIGSINKHDIIEAASIKEKEPLHGIIIGFSVKTEPHAKKEAKKRRIKIISDNVIYSLIEEYEEFVKKEKERLIKEKEKRIVRPAKFQFLKGYVFRKSKPAIFGIRVLEGKLQSNARVLNEKGEIVGKIECIECEGEKIPKAEKGREIAIALQGGVVEKNIQEGDTFYTFIPAKQFDEVCSLDLSEKETELFEKIRELETVKEEAK